MVQAISRIVVGEEVNRSHWKSIGGGYSAADTTAPQAGLGARNQLFQAYGFLVRRRSRELMAVTGQFLMSLDTRGRRHRA